MLCKLIIITGPTATGKTRLGIQVARELGGEVISVDSRQIYRYMDIGTAKPSRSEQALARHHFIDIKNPDQRFSAGQFGKQARELIGQMQNRGVLPVLVGGSGLYLQATLDGFFEDRADHTGFRTQMQQRLKKEGLQILYDELGQLDPLAQARLSPRDTHRITRALEVACLGERKLSERWVEEAAVPLECIPVAFCLKRQRDRLYRRIEQRVDAMMAQGLLEEVEELIARGYGRESCAMGTLAYQEILDYLDGTCSLAQAVETIKRRTRRYAKRQLTWFRRDRRLRWLDLDQWGNQGACERIVAHCRAQIL